MEKSQTIKELATALVKFQSQVDTVKKDGTNPFFKSSYATLEKTIETVRVPLQNNGLSFSQFPSGVNGLTTILMHTSGEYLQSTITMAPKDNTPQGQGSAITYMRRYALSAILGIATEEDDDGNEASKANRPAKTVEKKPEPVKKPVSNKQALGRLCRKLDLDLKSLTLKDDIKKLTSLEVVEENYPEIISRLELIVKERTENQ